MRPEQADRQTDAQPRLPAADCHVHIFDGAYPFAANPRYIPDESLRGTGKQLLALLDCHGLTHALIVGAAPYKGNNKPLLDAIKVSNGRFKGIALIPDPATSDADLQALNDAGVVGMRVDFERGLDEITGADRERLLSRIKEMGWFLEIHCKEPHLLAAEPILKRVGVNLLIDHCGRPQVALGLKQPGFQLLLELGKAGRAVAKLSGPFRFSNAGHPYKDVDPFVAAVIDAYGVDHCVWGSDWPFVNMGERVDYGPPMTCLTRWLPDAADRRAVLWDTPARLFGFKGDGISTAKSQEHTAPAGVELSSTYR